MRADARTRAMPRAGAVTTLLCIRIPVDRLSTTQLVRVGAVGVVAPGAATCIGLALDLYSQPGAQVVYVVFAAIAARAAGLEAGLLTGLLSIPPFIYFFLNNPEEFDVTASEVVSLIVLALGVVLVS